MSRTIRRTKEKKRLKSGKSHFVKDYVTDYAMPEGVEAWRGAKTVYLTGKEYDKGYYTFHGDTQRNFGWSNPPYDRKESINAWRNKNKMEIIRFIQNNDHEVVVHKVRCLSWER